MYDEQNSDTQDPSSYAPTSTSTSLYDAVASIYRNALGREGSEQEINGWIQGKTPNDLGAIQTAIYGSPEAQAYGARNQNPPPPTAPGPLPPGPQPPAPGPAPAPGASAFPSGQAPPTFTPPPITKPEPWNYQSFIAPSPDEVNSDPWTQYQLKTGADQIQRSAAARGILNTGGTISDLMRGADEITNAGYANIFNRAAQTYGMNRQNSLDAYNVNNSTQYQDPLKWNYQSAQDTWNAQSHTFDSLNNYSWAKTLFGADQDDRAFDRKYKIFSSL
jgi:hypothetical protein